MVYGTVTFVLGRVDSMTGNDTVRNVPAASPSTTDASPIVTLVAAMIGSDCDAESDDAYEPLPTKCASTECVPSEGAPTGISANDVPVPCGPGATVAVPAGAPSRSTDAVPSGKNAGSSVDTATRTYAVLPTPSGAPVTVAVVDVGVGLDDAGSWAKEIGTCSPTAPFSLIAREIQR